MPRWNNSGIAMHLMEPVDEVMIEFGLQITLTPKDDWSGMFLTKTQYILIDLTSGFVEVRFPLSLLHVRVSTILCGCGSIPDN